MPNSTLSTNEETKKIEKKTTKKNIPTDHKPVEVLKNSHVNSKKIQKNEEKVQDELEEMLSEVKHDQHQKKDDMLMYVSVGVSTLIILIVSVFAVIMWQNVQRLESRLTTRVENVESQSQINAQRTADLEASLKNSIPGFTIEKTQADIKQPTTDERWLGSKDAQYVWIVYSDFDCPFCKRIWPDLEKLPTDQQNVAVVFRNLPLPQLHPNAEKVARAAECIADIDGNDAYFKFVHDYKVEQKISAEFSNISSYVSNVDKFNSCLTEGKTAAKVDRDKNEALREGITGTPTSILYNLKTKETKIIRGAVPYSQIVSELQAFKK